MNDIQVEEWIRTKNGKIRTVKNIVAQYYITDRLNASDNNQFTKEDIVRHSFNKIGLVEVGDYVDGYLVDNIEDKLNENGEHEKVIITGELTLYDIRSILTKEQFKEKEYVFDE